MFRTSTSPTTTVEESVVTGPSCQKGLVLNWAPSCLIPESARFGVGITFVSSPRNHRSQYRNGLAVWQQSCNSRRACLALAAAPSRFKFPTLTATPGKQNGNREGAASRMNLAGKEGIACDLEGTTLLGVGGRLSYALQVGGRPDGIAFQNDQRLAMSDRKRSLLHVSLHTVLVHWFETKIGQEC